jgi:hypothetical protein
MNQSPEAFLSRMPPPLRAEVGDPKLVEIYKNMLRVREVMLCGLLMTMIFKDSEEFRILEDYADNINQELGKQIDPRATLLIEALGLMMPTHLRKMYNGIIRELSNIMTKEIQEAWDKV